MSDEVYEPLIDEQLDVAAGGGSATRNRVPCIYCRQYIAADLLREHINVCEKNPKNRKVTDQNVQRMPGEKWTK